MRVSLPRHILIITLVLMLIAMVARALPGARTIDDAFITFRYSRNLLDGIGFVYNPGVVTLGTSTPLFALIMAAVGASTGGRDFQTYAIIVSALADALTVALIYAIARRYLKHDWLSAVPALLYAISPMSVTFAIGGMETSLNILWMIAATYLYVAHHTSPRAQIAIGVCAALGMLTRADAALWIVPLFVWQLLDGLITRKDQPFFARLPLRTWITAAIILLPFMLIAWAAFGSPIPNSVTAKRFAYIIEPGSALIRLIQTYSTPFFEFDTFGSIGAMIGAVLYTLLTLIGIIYAARKLPRLLPFLIYPWIYFAVFAILNPLIFRWYLAPPIPALMLGIIGGLWGIFNLRHTDDSRPTITPPVGTGLALSAAKSFSPDSTPPLHGERGLGGEIGRRIATLLLTLAAILWIFTSLNGWTLTPDHGSNRPAPRMAWHEIEILYQRMGELLRDQYSVTLDTRVASGDIGAVGFFSGATIVDTVGLVTPELTAYYPVDPSLIAEGQNYAIPPQLIRDTMPDYLVTMEGFIREGLAREDWFNAQYELIESFPTDFYGTGMLLYRRTN